MTDEASKGESALERLLHPSVLVALITVVGGGIFGSMITTRLQMSAKERELSLAGYRETVNARLKIVTDTYDLVGRTIVAADQLIVITRPEFVVNDLSDEAQRATAEQKSEIRKTFNDTNAEWRRTELRNGLLVAYYHGGSPEVTAAWSDVVKSVDAYLACARDWFLAHPGGAEAIPACRMQRQSAMASLSRFGIALEKARRSEQQR